MSALKALDTASPRSKEQGRLSLRAIEIRWGTLFITPWIIGFLLFTAGPMLVSLYLSFTDFSLLSNNDPTWLGTQNYSNILGLELKPLAQSNQNSAEVLDQG